VLLRLTARAVATLIDLLIDEVLERIGQGDVRRGHGAMMALLAESGNGIGSDLGPPSALDADTINEVFESLNPRPSRNNGFLDRPIQ
jgi:hypothetical protein